MKLSVVGFAWQYRGLLWLLPWLLLLPLSVQGQPLAPPPGVEPPPRITPPPMGAVPPPQKPEQAVSDPQALRAQLDELKRKREELYAWRDELARREQHLAAGQEPATPEQLAEIQHYRQQAVEAYQRALQAQQRLDLLKEVEAGLATAFPLEVDPRQVTVKVYPATARLQINVRAGPDVDSAQVTSLDEGEPLVVLGTYGGSEWLLVSAKGQLGFLRQAELNTL